MFSALYFRPMKCVYNSEWHVQVPKCDSVKATGLCVPVAAVAAERFTYSL